MEIVLLSCGCGTQNRCHLTDSLPGLPRSRSKRPPSTFGGNASRAADLLACELLADFGPSDLVLCVRKPGRTRRSHEKYKLKSAPAGPQVALQMMSAHSALRDENPYAVLHCASSEQVSRIVHW